MGPEDRVAHQETNVIRGPTRRVRVFMRRFLLDGLCFAPHNQRVHSHLFTPRLVAVTTRRCYVPGSYCRLQSKCRSRLEERLAQDWRRAFSEQLVDSVQDIYDFFQSDARLFASSALFRLLKHLELRMSSHLRTLLTVRACRMYR